VIEGVLIDMGGVLCDVDEQRAYAAWEAHTKLPGEVLRAELYDRGLKEEFDKGLKQPGGVSLFLKYRFEIPLTKSDWANIWGAAVSANAAMDDFARALAVHVPIALASTTDKVHHTKLQGELKCLELFRAQAVSYEIGYIKPDPRFYHRAIEMLGTAAASTVFIDDREENVQGAVDAGMQGLRFISLEKLREDLARLGLPM
jgi:FMN phosphatase YigB (HAD superfamily)